MLFAEFPDSLHCASAEQSKITALWCQSFIDGLLHKRIESRRCNLFEDAFAVSCNSLRRNNVEALFELIDHRLEQFWWILEVGVHNHYSIAVCKIQAGGYGSLLAKVATKAENFHTAVMYCFGI